MKHKIALFLCGGSGTGKTSSRERILLDAKLTTPYVYINVDTYRTEMSAKQAQEMVHHMVEKSIVEGKSFVLDATCRNTATIIGYMNEAKRHGFKVVLSMIYATLGTTLDRIEKRPQQTVPSDVVKTIYTELKRKAERYMHVESIDELYLYNNEHTTTLLLNKKNDIISCRHPHMKFYFDIKQFC
jgi:predicted ABC-type ATPase